MEKTVGKGCKFTRGLARLNFPKKMQGGFTLIELLVVISIMGLLSSVVLSSVQSARKKADDTQRNQIVGEYVKALALAYDKLYRAFTETIMTSVHLLRIPQRF